MTSDGKEAVTGDGKEAVTGDGKEGLFHCDGLGFSGWELGGVGRNSDGW